MTLYGRCGVQAGHLRRLDEGTTISAAPPPVTAGSVPPLSPAASVTAAALATSPRVFEAAAAAMPPPSLEAFGMGDHGRSGSMGRQTSPLSTGRRSKQRRPEGFHSRSVAGSSVTESSGSFGGGSPARGSLEKRRPGFGVASPRFPSTAPQTATRQQSSPARRQPSPARSASAALVVAAQAVPRVLPAGVSAAPPSVETLGTLSDADNGAGVSSDSTPIPGLLRDLLRFAVMIVLLNVRRV